MAILDQDIDKVVNAIAELHPRPMTEAELRIKLVNRLGDTRLGIAVNEAQSRNLIRWVAFEGWLKGGRPH